MDMRLFLARQISKGISLFAPKYARDYLQENIRLSFFYKAGSVKGPSGRFGLAPFEQNTSIAREAKLIRTRARLLINNSPNVSGALRKIINNVVYKGIKPQVQFQSRRKEKQTEELWQSWQKSQDLWKLQKQVLRHLIVDGGIFLHFYTDKDNAVCPLGIELMTLDRLDESINGKLENGNFAFKGIELDARKNVVAYHIKEEQGYAFYMGLNFLQESKRILAKELLLIFNQEYVGQLLPVSWLHSVIMTMHNFDEYQESEQIAARLAAAFGVFLKTSAEYSGYSLNGLGGGTDSQNRPVSMNNYITSGRIDTLPPGTEIEIVENKRPGSNYVEYSKQCQKTVSSGMGLSYENFSNDFSEASFSSARTAILEERRGYEVLQEFLIQYFLLPVWEKFEEYAKDFGMVGSKEEIKVRWQRPGWGWVDPVKDSNAKKVQYEMGMTSLGILCAEQGYDFEEIALQRQKEQEFLDNIGNMQEKNVSEQKEGKNGQDKG